MVQMDIDRWSPSRSRKKLDCRWWVYLFIVYWTFNVKLFLLIIIFFKVPLFYILKIYKIRNFKNLQKWEFLINWNDHEAWLYQIWVYQISGIVLVLTNQIWTNLCFPSVQPHTPHLACSSLNYSTWWNLTLCSGNPL